ncbi:ribosomal protein L7/L12 [Lutispora thermophila]|uniref:Ribosomal protein L7/L12 n=1 Tax=Lutispora thermophila DSM 19022 TaxID=1122184 RepID=A0A1M6IKS6_9FIRM|nr:ribosomal protein L7/L12 [Lutispora thermophila]SHJ35102.1 ribosomal protein L7/L12 [Lutispora thermophila DSM 19022]
MMFDELQELAMKKILKRAAACVGIMAIIIILFTSSFMKLIQGPVDLYSLSKDELLGSYVEGDVYYILDGFATSSETSRSGKKINKRNYYIIPICEEEYIALGVYSGDFNTANRMIDETYEYITGARDDVTTTLHVRGTIRKMNSKLITYYNNWFQRTGFLGSSMPEEIEKYALTYVLDSDYVGSFSEGYIYVAIIVCACILIYMIISLIKGFSGAYLRPIKSFIKNNEGIVSIEEIEKEYHEAETVDSVKISKNYTFYFKGPKSFIVKNDDIVWAYLRSTTHRTNGIKAHVTKSLILHTINKKTHTIDMSSEEDVNSVLEFYSYNNPHIILGYSDELMKCYKNEFDTFLKMSQDNRQSAASYDEQDDTSRVILLNSGENIIQVINSIREYLECGLEEAKDLVDNTPCIIKENISLQEAEAIKAELENIGATVEIN